MKQYGRLLIGIGTGTIIVGFLLLSLVNFFYRSDIVTGAVINQEITRLAQIFQTIHKQCTIIGFDAQQNPINFLNVKTFTGSEVGPMNLAHPEQWRGPYVCDNPTLQGKEFMVVHTNDGYFITPGNGVRLPNGKLIGTDILLSKEADIRALMHDTKGLNFEGHALAHQLSI